MSITHAARGWRTRVLAALVAVAAVFGTLQLGVDEAGASPNRANLRPGCSFDIYKHWVQICQVWSPSMDTHIPVQIVPSRDGGNKALYLLDGLRGPEGYSEWVWEGHAPNTFENSNLNLVMPGGGTASFYTDWNRPSINAAGRQFNYQFETFLTRELPDYLARHFGISTTGNSIGGLSMGASAALSLAYNHPDKFAQALGFSGYLHTTAPGMSAAIAAAQLDAGGYNSLDMWGLPMSPERVRNDPFLNIDKLKNVGDVYLSSASGLPMNLTQPDILYTLPDQAIGIGLEALSRASTLEFENAARAAGLDLTVNYTPDGIHSWQLWDRDLAQVKERVLNFQNAW
ncbi:antigen 85-B [Corynebacterium sphenisci DSM 44792]|uniref:Antigen 85-B n=1 Tax=Corynebacterium sphenisci DSM 44792 TaxID=1437874 RepID=A0A1L7D049_9CORY|nr:alpha/beta hydrolase family protein [Corynebacterium sphenisci]APT91509.1 antigen 85-B [Corynebacterium sphenisci DSM 44792]